MQAACKIPGRDLQMLLDGDAHGKPKAPDAFLLTFKNGAETLLVANLDAPITDSLCNGTELRLDIRNVPNGWLRLAPSSAGSYGRISASASRRRM
jgi:hypothetical protein